MRNLVVHAVIVLMILVTDAGAALAQDTDISDKAFATFLAKADAAQLELQNGKGEAFKSVWSHAHDVTLSGGFGGTVEKGWTAVAKRLDWVVQNFSKGTNTIERLVTNQNGTLGYVVQMEHISFIVPTTGKPATRDYRVTMIFRRERDGWRIVHRQADAQLTRQAPGRSPEGH